MVVSNEADDVSDQEFEKMLRSLVRDTFFDIVNDPVFGARLLKTPFYFSTKPFIKRPLISSELFQPIRQENGVIDNARKIIFIPFYLQITRLYYEGQSDAMASYVDIRQQGLIETLDDLKFSNTALPEMLNLFAPLHVQERRLGCMFEYWDSVNDFWTYEIRIPFLYQEYNYYLSSKERKNIQDFFSHHKTVATQAPATQGAGAGGVAGLIKFIQRHLISDKCGIDDSHIIFKRWYTTVHMQGFVGCGLIVPIAFPLKQGLVGNHFETKKERPVFDLHTDLLELYVDGNFDQLKTNALNLGIEITDRLSTILLEQQLGNRRHWGLTFAGFAESLGHKMSASVYIQSDVLLPMVEKRFIRKKLDTVALNAASTDVPVTEQQAAVDVAVLNSTFLDKMFPERYAVMVFPGFSTHITTKLSSMGKKWKGSVGLDFWLQSQEWWGNISCNNTAYLDPQVAQKGYAFQQNFFLELISLPEKERKGQWAFQTLISGSLISKGIGKLIGISISLFKSF